jgi:hypothetical protein
MRKTKEKNPVVNYDSLDPIVRLHLRTTVPCLDGLVNGSLKQAAMEYGQDFLATFTKLADKVTDWKIMLALMQAGEKDREFPNKCLGLGCQVKLPPRVHFCTDCRRKTRGLRESSNNSGSRYGNLLSGAAK